MILLILSVMYMAVPFGRVVGLLTFLGVLGVEARKSQGSGGSKFWLIAEIPAVLFITVFVVVTLLNGRWYEQPIDCLIVPAIFYIFYFKY